MKVVRQRNLYLQNLFQEQPHKYSFDMDKGRYSLITPKGTHRPINVNGVLKQRFRANYSGCVDHRTRAIDQQNDPSCMYYTPTARPQNRYRTLAPVKFAGYAQCPYQIHQSPSHLREAGQASFREPSRRTRTEEAEAKPARCSTLNSERQLQPRPPNRKACYNNRCRSIRQIAIEELLANREGEGSGAKERSPFKLRQMLGLSFHQSCLREQSQERARVGREALALRGGKR